MLISLLLMLLILLIREVMHYIEVRYLERVANQMVIDNIEMLKLLQRAGIAMPARAMNDE
jgi:hypothetical protein